MCGALECQAAPQPSMSHSDSLFRLTVPVHPRPSPRAPHPTTQPSVKCCSFGPLLICSEVSLRLPSSIAFCSAVAAWMCVLARSSITVCTYGCRYCCCCCRCRCCGGWEARCEKGPAWLFGRFQMNNFGSPWSTAKLGKVVAAQLEAMIAQYPSDLHNF